MLGNRKKEQEPPAPCKGGGPFALLTLHRPSNVDDPAILSEIVHFLTDELATEMPLLWTVHPRTEK